MKNFMKEFKEFALKGNVMDMAVGVIIGAAFKAIVDSLVADIISPVLGLITQQNFSDLSVSLFDGQVVIAYGNFITAVINFVLMALVLFTIVKALNKLESLKKKPEEAPAEPVKSDETKALEEIITLLKEKK